MIFDIHVECAAHMIVKTLGSALPAPYKPLAEMEAGGSNVYTLSAHLFSFSI
jgi:hypothetical protein